jgi:hypothetical protein
LNYIFIGLHISGVCILSFCPLVGCL